MKKYPNFADLAAIAGVFLMAQFVLGGGVASVLKVLGISHTLAMAVAYPLFMIAAIVFAVYYRQTREGERYMPRLRFTFRREWLPVLGWGLLTMLAAGVVLEPLLELFPESWYDLMKEAIGHGGWVVLTTVVMAPLLEEVLFRGLLQDATVNRYGAVRGILIASAVFGVVHLIPMQVISAFVMGLVLGYVYYRTRSLLPPVLLHAANNLIAYLTMDITLEDGSQAMWLHDMIAAPALYWTVYGGCVALVIFGAVRMWRSLDGKSAVPHTEA